MRSFFFWSVLTVIFVVTPISTVYYNWFDQGLMDIATRFENGSLGDMKCGGSSIDENGHTIRASCEGGILTERDAYLKDNNILLLGEWTIDSGSANTFAIYLQYWP